MSCELLVQLVLREILGVLVEGFKHIFNLTKNYDLLLSYLAQPVHGEEAGVQPPLVHDLHQVPRHVIRQVGRHLEHVQHNYQEDGDAPLTWNWSQWLLKVAAPDTVRPLTTPTLSDTPTPRCDTSTGRGGLRLTA